MVGQKVAGIATHDRDIGFRFGIGPEPKRKLDADTPARSKRLAQGFTGQVDRRGMRSVLRLGDDESSFQDGARRRRSAGCTPDGSSVVF